MDKIDEMDEMDGSKPLSISSIPCQRELYCQVRKKRVVGSPEERVRQGLIQHMVKQLGFPLQSLAVEKSLAQMPHLQAVKRQLPERRADLLCFAKGVHAQHAIYPLLLVECKAIALTEEALQQLIGYNHYLQAYFITLSNGTKTKTGWYDPAKKSYDFLDGLPSYESLLVSINNS